MLLSNKKLLKPLQTSLLAALVSAAAIILLGLLSVQPARAESASAYCLAKYGENNLQMLNQCRTAFDYYKCGDIDPKSSSASTTQYNQCLNSVNDALSSDATSAQTKALNECESKYPDNDFDNDAYKACVASVLASNDSSSNISAADLKSCEEKGYSEEECAAFQSSTFNDYSTSGAHDCNGVPTSFDVDCGDDNPIYGYLTEIINFLSAGVGIVVIIMIALGGIQYMSAGGNPQATQAAVHRIVNAILAMVVFIFIWAFLNWLVPGGML